MRRCLAARVACVAQLLSVASWPQAQTDPLVGVWNVSVTKSRYEWHFFDR